MTFQDSYVEQSPNSNSGDPFDRWLDATSSPNRFGIPNNRSMDPEADDIDADRRNDIIDGGGLVDGRHHRVEVRLSNEYTDSSPTGYPRRLDPAPESRHGRLLDWLFSPGVRNNTLVVTTAAMLGLGAWLLVSELTRGSSPALDLDLFGSSDIATIQSTSAGDSDSGVPSTQADTESADGDLNTVSGTNRPGTSTDGNVSLAVASVPDGWTATVDISRDPDVASVVKFMVNGEVVGEQSSPPYTATILKADFGDDVATLVVTSVVEWADGSKPAVPVSVAIASTP